MASTCSMLACHHRPVGPSIASTYLQVVIPIDNGLFFGTCTQSSRLIQALVLQDLESLDTQIGVRLLTSAIRLLWYACPDLRAAEPYRALLTSKYSVLQADHNRQPLRSQNPLQVLDQSPNSLHENASTAPSCAMLSYILLDMPSPRPGKAITLFTKGDYLSVPHAGNHLPPWPCILQHIMLAILHSPLPYPCILAVVSETENKGGRIKFKARIASCRVWMHICPYSRISIRFPSHERHTEVIFTKL